MENVAAMISDLFRENQTPVPLHEPSFGQDDMSAVLDCLETGWVSTAGKYVGEFEQKINSYIGSRYCVVVNSGTSALHLALCVAKVKSNHEVFCPAATFIATANAISYLGATPHFIDCGKNDPNICIDKFSKYLEQNFDIIDNQIINRVTQKRVSAIIPMHAFGMAVDIEKLKRVIGSLDIAIIEDAAEAFGSEVRGNKIGSQSNLATFSFNGNKILTTGAGGAIVTTDETIFLELKHISTTAKLSHQYEFIHDMVGYNYRLPNINAALGVSQIDKMGATISAKQKVFDFYKSYFDRTSDFTILSSDITTVSNNWLVVGVLSDGAIGQLDDIMQQLNARRIFVRPLWRPMHKLEMFTNCPRGDLSNVEDLYKRMICLPSSPTLSFAA